MNKSTSRPLRIAAVALSLILAASTAPTASAAKAKVGIGVAPSPNGYVMQGEPTQIAISGAKRAKVYLERDGKWRLLGTARAKRALPYTFTEGGLQRIRVKPKKKKARTFRVPVYQEKRTNTPEAYAGVIFINRPSRIPLETTTTLRESDGCVLVDVGGDVTGIEVLSAGAPPWQGSASPDEEIAQQGIPVAGDTVIQWTNPRGGRIQAGYNAVCLNP